MRTLALAIRSLITRYVNSRRAGVQPDNGTPHHLISLDAAAIARLREMVDASGLGIHRLAAGSGCTPEYLEALLQGSRDWIHPDVMRDLARVLQTYPGWIVSAALDPGETLGARILELRRARGFSQKTLAEMMEAQDGTGVHPGHIRRLERGDIRRPREDTLRALAGALGVSTRYLLTGGDADPDAPAAPGAPGPSTTPRRRWRLAAFGATAIAVAVVVMVRNADAPGPARIPAESLQVRLTQQGHTVEAVDPLTNRVQWHTTFAASVAHHRQATWNGERVLLVGLDRSVTEEAGGFLVYRLADGHPIVADLPDDADRAANRELAGASGNELCFSWRSYSVTAEARLFADLDGDGTDELLVPASHEHHRRPSRFRVYAADGSTRGTYYVSGELTFHLADDFDADGRDEILLCATSDDPAQLGFSLIVLDDGHLDGVSRDAVGRSACRMTDGALAGITFPAFDPPLMDALGALRLMAWETQFLPGTDMEGTRFVVWIGADPDFPAILYLDGALRPVTVSQSDALVNLLGQKPGTPRGDSLRAGLREWSRRGERFGAARVDRPRNGGAVVLTESADAPRR